MRTDNPPKSQYEEYERRLSAHAFMAQILFTLFTLCSFWVFVSAVRTEHRSQIEIILTALLAIGSFIFTLLLVATDLSKRVINTKSFNHLKNPYPLISKTIGFRSEMKEGNSVDVIVTFLLPEASEETLKRIEMTCLATLGRYFSSHSTLPTFDQIYSLLDTPLTAIADELQIPVLYPQIQSCTSGYQGAVMGEML